jgi:hypothetical protein
MRTLTIALALFIAMIAWSTAYPSEPPEIQAKLLNRILAGTKCEDVPNNGRRCVYKVGTLHVSIKDVGGSDTVVGFQHSDSKEEFFAVMYFGCVAVIPSRYEAMKHDRNFGVFISPVTGKVYLSPNECRAASQGS